MILVGNFIADFVKGKQILGFPEEIRDGIAMHRAIDHYTDNHAIVDKSKKRLRSKYRHYAPVIVDMYYDHFLAKNWNSYHNESLLDFTENTYETLLKHKKWLPERATHMLKYMIPQNWMYSYSKVEGITQALAGMARRTTFESKMEESHQELLDYYEENEEEFKTFFPEMIKFAQNFHAPK